MKRKRFVAPWCIPVTVLGWRVESRLSPWLSREGRTCANVSVLVCGLKGISHTGRVGGVAGGFSASPLFER